MTVHRGEKGRGRRWRAIVVAGALASTGLTLAQGAPARAATARVGSVPVVDPSLVPAAAPASTTTLRTEVALVPRDPAGLSAYAAAVSDPAAPEYHRYLSTADFAARFGAGSGTVATIQRSLRAVGLTVGTVDPDGLFIPVSGTLATYQRSLSISFRGYRAPDGRAFFANTDAPALPTSIAGSVRGLVGLDNLTVAQPASLAQPSRIASQATPNGSGAHPATSGPTPCSSAIGAASAFGAHTADQLATAYSINSVYSTGDLGAGVTIAIYELEPYTQSLSDTTTFASCYGITPSVSYESVDGGPVSGGPSSGGLETQLDIDTIIELAPRANVVVYQGPNSVSEATADGPFDTYKQIVDDHAASVISTSWGACEFDMGYTGSVGAQAESVLFDQAASQGQSITAASGDEGAEGCHYTGTGDPSAATDLEVQDPSSQPTVTGVGGTSLTNVSTTPPTESAWVGSGGGISQFWSMPGYQQSAPVGLNVINAHSTHVPCGVAVGMYCRQVPDVAAVANPNTGFVIYFGGWGAVGGTSGGAPLWAALLALADANTTCAPAPVGAANTALYAIAGSSAYSSAFNDVTTGNNDATHSHPTVYAAGAGYDLATGLGTPNAAGLLPLLGNPCIAAITPPAPTTGSTVTITGEHLSAASAVTFGGIAANASTIAVNPTGTSLTVTLPAGTGPGAPTTTVTTPRGTSSPFTPTQPTIGGVAPSIGTTGTSVTITGTGFTGATTVTFGGIAATSFSVVSDSSITAVAPAGVTGPVDVSVTTSGGSTVANAADQLTAPAAVTSIAANAGVAGTSITIAGSGFTGAMAVRFGGTAAPSFSIISPTSISATVPPGPTGTVAVTVSNSAGASTVANGDRFTFGVPVVSSLSIAIGGGGTGVIVSGSGFTNATGVQFGTTPAPFSVTADGTITATAPSGPAGLAPVTVRNAAGLSTTVAASQFTYPAHLSSAAPPTGPAGTSVAIVGAGFSAVAATGGVSFGTIPATYTVNSDSTITATAPAGFASAVAITVTDPAGASTGSVAFTYPPTLSSLSLQSGPTSGGATLLITGAGFSSIAASGAVRFGNTLATYTVIDDASLSVVVPTSDAGTVIVSVTGPGGTSPSTAVAAFTYEAPVVQTTIPAAPATATPPTVPPVTTVPVGRPSARASRVIATPTAVDGDGRARSTIRVSLLDSSGRPVPGRRVKLAVSGGVSTISPPTATTDGSGVATFQVRSTHIGTISYRATDTSDSVAIIDGATVTYGVAPSARTSRSVVTAAPTKSCRGASRATVTVTLRSATGAPLPGRTVTVATTVFRGTAPQGTATSSTGTATFTFVASKPQRITVTAKDVADGFTLAQRVTLTFPGTRAC